jgi:hypothetical protein
MVLSGAEPGFDYRGGENMFDHTREKTSLYITQKFFI